MLCSAPSATPSLVISARPRVMSAALALKPSPKPSAIPVATAITFLSAPPSSTPVTSVCVYARKVRGAECSLRERCRTRTFGRNDNRRRLALHDLRGKARPGKGHHGGIRNFLLRNLGHQRESLWLESFAGDDDRCLAPEATSAPTLRSDAAPAKVSPRSPAPRPRRLSEDHPWRPVSEQAGDPPGSERFRDSR